VLTRLEKQTMDESRRLDGSSERGLKEDDIISRLVPNATVPAEVTALEGFLGKSASAGFWRLYRTLELNDYVEIAEGDIVYSQSLATPKQPLRGSMVWVKRDAPLRHTRTETRQVQAELLQGDITGGFLSDLEGPRLAGAELAQARRTRPCLTWGCCRFGRLLEELPESRKGFLEGDIVGLFLNEALGSEDSMLARSHRTHRCLTLGCCPEGPVSRGGCNLAG
jgi:hypothetical protein